MDGTIFRPVIRSSIGSTVVVGGAGAGTVIACVALAPSEAWHDTVRPVNTNAFEQPASSVTVSATVYCPGFA